MFQRSGRNMLYNGKIDRGDTSFLSNSTVNESNLQIHQIMNYIDGCPCPVVVNRKSTSALRKSKKHCAHNASPCDHLESGPYTLL